MRRESDLLHESDEQVMKMETPRTAGGEEDQSIVNWVEQVMAADDDLQDGVREAWLPQVPGSGSNHQDLLNHVYGDFPPLPDFPCMSSSSSSSSSSSVPVINASAKPPLRSSSSASSSSSSSSAASRVLVRTEEQRNMEIVPAEIDRMDSDCMHVMEELGDMDLLDTDDIWDPSSLFPYETLEEEQQGELLMIQQEKEEGGNGGISTKQQQPCEDLAVVFLEWLKSNKETISAEDLRSIKLKRSTIECAAKRLGGGKEGMKQLLKLILEWVQNHQLQKKRVRETECETTTMAYGYPHQQNNPNPQPCIQNSNLNTNSNPNPNPNFNSIPSPDSNQYFYPSALPQTWIPHPMPSPTFRPVMGYMGEPMFNNGAIPSPFNNNTPNNITNSLENWPQNHFSLSPHYNSFPDQHLQSAPSPQNPFTNFVNQYPCQLYQGAHPDQLVRLGTSATKEARKKRMARQKRLFSHNRSSNNLQLQQSAAMEQHVRVDSMNNCTPNCANHGNWMYWPTSTFVAPSPITLPDSSVPSNRSEMQPHQQYQRQITVDRRQGCKSIPEKNLKFLLQKVLKQSDVGNLGRIVLPKKEAETYLPELEARDGISIAMEDIGTSRVWNMRYRFWPNNKSRMYLLENTGDFVRSNGLQEGDFIVIYSDIKCGKYMIRGVKVRQSGSKLETKKQGKTHRNVRVTTTMGIGSSSSMMEQVT